MQHLVLNTVKLASTAGKVHVRNTFEQMKLVGPRSLGVSLLTAGFVGMVFTIQARLASGNLLNPSLTFPVSVE